MGGFYGCMAALQSRAAKENKTKKVKL